MVGYYFPINWGVHTVRVTLMKRDYVGHAAFKVKGNCKGMSVLDPILFFDVSAGGLVENDCRLEYIDGYEVYQATLKNAEGDEIVVTADQDELESMIVRIEIVDFHEET